MHKVTIFLGKVENFVDFLHRKFEWDDLPGRSEGAEILGKEKWEKEKKD